MKGIAPSRGDGELGEGRWVFSAALPEPCLPDAAQETSALDEICSGPLGGSGWICSEVSNPDERYITARTFRVTHTPTLLRNHNNHDNVTSTGFETEGMNTTVSAIWKDKVHYCSIAKDSRPRGMIWCSGVTHKWKWKCSAIIKKKESCLVNYTATPTHIRLWLSNRAPYLYRHNSCTVSTSLFQAATLSWNQLHLRDVGDDSWRLKWAIYTVFISIHCSIAFQAAYPTTVAWWLLSNIECLPSNSQWKCASHLPNKHDSQSKWHFTLNGWLLYITEWRVEQTNIMLAHSWRAKWCLLPFGSPWKQPNTQPALSSASTQHTAVNV